MSKKLGLLVIKFKTLLSHCKIIHEKAVHA